MCCYVQNHNIYKNTMKTLVQNLLTEEDIEFYRDMVEDYVRVDEPVYQQCERAVIAIMAYACTKEQDEEFEKWIQKYKNQTNFSPSQKTNFTYMKNSFDNFVQKMAV